MKINLLAYDKEIVASPDGYLGPSQFNLFRRACESAGARYLKTAGGNVIAMEKGPVLTLALSEAGFQVHIQADLKDILQAFRDKVVSDYDSVEKRIEQADARCIERFGKPMRPYQKDGARWQAPQPKGLLGDQQGLGKTLQELVAIPEGAPAIACGPAVAKPVWRDEAIWLRPDMKITVLSGKDSFRWPEPGELIITNYDILPPTPAEVKKGKPQVPQNSRGCPRGLFLIGDEVHYLKSSKSLRTARFRALAKAVWAGGGSVWGATATPLMNRPLELWSVLTTLGLQRDAFGTWSNFIRLFNGKKKWHGGYEFGEDGRDEDEIARCLKKVMLRRERKDVAPDLPTKSRQFIPVEISKRTARVCDQALTALDKLGISLDDAIERMAGGGDMPAFEEWSRARKELAIAMIPTMMKMVEDYEDAEEPLLVFSYHTAPLKTLMERPGWSGIIGGIPHAQRDRTVKDFQAGKLKGLALSIRAAGTALTLTHAHHEIFVDQSPVPPENEQAEDREVRYGQDSDVLVRIFVPDHPLAQRMVEITTSKMSLIDGTVGAATVKEMTPALKPDDFDGMIGGTE